MPAPAWRSDVVGSLLRPPTLVQARAALEAGAVTAADFKRVEDRAVDEAIGLQESAGLDVVTDGELRRYAFFGHLVDAIEGFDKYGGWAIPFRGEQGEQLVFKRPVVVEKLRWRRSLITTKKGRLESVDELRRRIDEAARLVPLERLALSPQWGFASTMEGNRITPEEQRAKLARTAETARAVWRS